MEADFKGNQANHRFGEKNAFFQGIQNHYRPYSSPA
jgi:hypothetical protein